MGNTSAKNNTKMLEFKPHPGQLITLNNPGKGLYTYENIKLDFNTLTATKNNKPTTNVYLSIYKSIINQEIPCFVVCIDNICHTYFIKGNCLYKSNRIYDINESESISQRECLSKSFALFGDGSFEIVGIRQEANPKLVR